MKLLRVSSLLAGSRKLNTGIAIRRNRHRIRQTGSGYGGQPPYAIQNFLKENCCAFRGIPIAHGVQGNQAQIPGIETLLRAHRALYAQPHVSGEQQQAQRPSHLAQHQRVAQAPAPMLAQLHIAALLQRGREIGAVVCKAGASPKVIPVATVKASVNNRARQPGIRSKVIGIGSGILNWDSKCMHQTHNRKPATAARRSAARASIMLATLAQAISRTRPPITRKNSRKNGRSCLRSGITLPALSSSTRRPFWSLAASPKDCCICWATASNCASAAASVPPGRRRPVT